MIVIPLFKLFATASYLSSSYSPGPTSISGTNYLNLGENESKHYNATGLSLSLNEDHFSEL